MILKLLNIEKEGTVSWNRLCSRIYLHAIYALPQQVYENDCRMRFHQSYQKCIHTFLGEEGIITNEQYSVDFLNYIKSQPLPKIIYTSDIHV